MPDYVVPGGPAKVRILNGSQSKTIKKVTIGVKPPIEEYREDSVDVTILSSTGRQVVNSEATDHVETLCIFLHWELADDPGVTGDSICCCADGRMYPGVDTAVVTYHEDNAMDLLVYPVPWGTRPFSCECDGMVPPDRGSPSS